MSRPSTQPPRQPQATPTAAPVRLMAATKTRVEIRLVRSPTRIRESRSRPSWSVPAGWAGEGADSTGKIWALGS